MEAIKEIAPRIGLLQQYDRAVVRITDQRGEDYGHPHEAFGRCADLKALVSDCPNPQVRHALEMICVKVSRLVESPNHLDSWVDIAGYARTAVMCLDYEENDDQRKEDI